MPLQRIGHSHLSFTRSYFHVQASDSAFQFNVGAREASATANQQAAATRLYSNSI